MGRRPVDTESHRKITCPSCCREHWVVKDIKQTRANMLCERCSPPKCCPKCGQRFKKAHQCKRADRDVLYAETHLRPLSPLKSIGPKDVHRFCSIECNFDSNHLHVGDITNKRAIVAHCNRRMMATRVVKYVPLSVWGVLEAGDKLGRTYHGRWCRRCYALVLRLLGDQTDFRVSIHEKP